MKAILILGACNCYPQTFSGFDSSFTAGLSSSPTTPIKSANLGSVQTQLKGTGIEAIQNQLNTAYPNTPLDPSKILDSISQRPIKAKADIQGTMFQDGFSETFHSLDSHLKSVFVVDGPKTLPSVSETIKQKFESTNKQ